MTEKLNKLLAERNIKEEDVLDIHKQLLEDAEMCRGKPANIILKI